MTNTLTAERIKELLDEIRAYEVLLKQYDGEPQTAPAWATLAIAKAKLTSLKGKPNDK
jgi:hypothetical protein